jgi:hypothetical protein
LPSCVEEIPLLAQHPSKSRELAVPHAPFEVALDWAYVGVAGLDLLGGGERLPVDLLGGSARIAGLVPVAKEQMPLMPDAIEELLLGGKYLTLGPHAGEEKSSEQVTVALGQLGEDRTLPELDPERRPVVVLVVAEMVLALDRKPEAMTSATCGRSACAQLS